MKIVPLSPDDQYSAELYEALDVHSEDMGFNTRKFPAEAYLFIAQSDDGIILGGIQGGISREWLDIYSLYSTRAVQGVGTALMDHIENYAREKNCHGVKLVTYPFQAPEFYKKRGYEMYATYQDPSLDYLTILMKKSIL